MFHLVNSYYAIITAPPVLRPVVTRDIPEIEFLVALLHLDEDDDEGASEGGGPLGSAPEVESMTYEVRC